MDALPLLSPRNANESRAWNAAAAKFKLFDAIGYKPHWAAHPRWSPECPTPHPVEQFHRSTAQHLVARAPARTSKSYASAPELVHAFLPDIDQQTLLPAHDEQVVWAIGVDYGTLKEWDYVWSYLAADDFALVRALGGTVTSKYNSPNAGNLRIVAEWGKGVSGRTARTVLVGKSSQNETSLQGEEVKLAVLSEAAEHEHRVVEKYLLTRCHRILYPTTPKRRALWLYELIERGREDKALSVEEVVFTRECNPEYPWHLYETARAKALATYGDWRDSPEFMEQFEGEWVFHEGKVLPFRWIDDDHLRAHVVSERDDRWPEFASWLPFADWIVSMDYGFTDAAVALFFAVSSDGQHLLVDEVHERFLSNVEFRDRIRSKERELRIKPRLYVPDPQKPEVTKLLRETGIPIFAGMNRHEHRDRPSSARALVDLLSVDPAIGRPRLHVHERCTRTIREWKMLRRKEPTASEAADEWAKSQLVGEQHHFDAARYYAKACRHHRATVTDDQWVRDHDRAWKARLARQQMAARWGPRMSHERVA